MLNEQQRRFVEEYAVDGNATHAAIRAGYAARTARQQGCRLLTRVDVAAAIAANGEERSRQRSMSNEQIEERLAKEATDADNHGSTRVSALNVLSKIRGLQQDRLKVDGLGAILVQVVKFSDGGDDGDGA